ncbi:interleukin-20 receptor subunit alpha-like isoform X2 [Lithobates pipiens]
MSAQDSLDCLRSSSAEGKNGSRNKTCDFQEKINAGFSSYNLNNILTWKPPENSTGLRYTVRYKRYGNKSWKKKLECTEIALTWCDLTNETRNDEQYYGKVIINNKNCSVETNRFYPLAKTEIGPPTVNLIPSNASITIQLTHPFNSLKNIVKGLEYHIDVNDIKKETKEPYYMIENIEPNTKYCVTAKVSWRNKKSNWSNKTCITANADHTSEQTIKGMIYILPVTAIFCTFILLGYATHKYIHGSNHPQPTILNISSSKNLNAILVDAHTVNINVITIEPGIPNLQETKMSGEEDTEFQNQTNQPITNDKDHVSCDSGVAEEADEESNNYYGYVSLQEQVITPRPTISPYDMPHHLQETIRPLSTSTNVCEKRDPYGYIKSNGSFSPVQENDQFDVVPNLYTSEKTTVSYPYFPHGVSDFSNVDTIKEDLCEPEDLFMDQKLDILNVIEDTDDFSTLFVDWSPEDPPFYIPNLSKKRELENCIKQCQETQEGLLSQLYLPPEAQETTKDDELEHLEERWGLLIKDAEK